MAKNNKCNDQQGTKLCNLCSFKYEDKVFEKATVIIYSNGDKEVNLGMRKTLYFKFYPYSLQTYTPKFSTS